jgi:hypothetical protein
MSRAHMQLGEDSKRLGKQHQAKESRAGPKWAQDGRPSPLRGPVAPPPFDLAAIQAIYSLEARRHASIHSPSTAEEQRREGHHLGEKRVELVD